MNIGHNKIYIGGKLNSLVSKRTRPLGIITGINAPARVVIPREERVPVLDTGDAGPSNTDLSLALAYCISRFYSEEGHHDINPGRLTASAVGIIAHFAKYSSLRPWESMKTAFKEANIQFIVTRASPAMFREFARNDTRLREFLELFGDDIGWVLRDTPVMIVIGSVILLACAKNINPQGYSGWLKNRIRGFCGTAGWQQLTTILSPALCPILSTMAAYNSFCSANFKIRKEMFLTILAISNDNFKNNITNCCTEIINLMRGCEMNHLILIDRLILQKYNELTYLSSMKGVKEVMADAISYLSTVDPSEALFVRILHDKDETAALNRNRFEVYATVATAVAQYENSTYDFYYMSDTESHQRLATLVKRYLSTRDKLLGLSAGDRPEAGMSPAEKEVFLKKAVEKFEKDMEEEGTTANAAGQVILTGGKFEWFT